MKFEKLSEDREETCDAKRHRLITTWGKNGKRCGRKAVWYYKFVCYCGECRSIYFACDKCKTEQENKHEAIFGKRDESFEKD